MTTAIPDDLPDFDLIVVSKLENNMISSTKHADSTLFTKYPYSLKTWYFAMPVILLPCINTGSKSICVLREKNEFKD